MNRIDQDLLSEMRNKINILVIDFINKFNNSMRRNYRVWELNFSYKNKLERLPINIIYDHKKYTQYIEIGRKNIKKYFDNVKLDNVLVEVIREVIIELFEEKYIEPFAEVDYGYAMTVDKSQGSTFDSIYIDAPDILDTDKYPFLDINVAKRRFYTGITRSAKEVNILL